ncbi:MAG: hypothetical protein C5B51_00390 [Terriglobia bacterium]|nr:MAG: hypothetical protein C5B51_00390 [Terriglobia bacterium]
MLRSLFIALVLASCLFAADIPQVDISNGVVRATLYLPDAQNGYYRGTRFDWSGVIARLEYAGHNYFGQWFPKYDPKLHDAITGPVEEFRTGNSALNYAEANSGETFVKIGVGVLRKPEEKAYRFATPYEMVDGGQWTVKTGADSVEFTQQATDPSSGYAYLYRKTVRLTPGKPQLVLEHRLTNTGKKVIDMCVYDHNFFMIDGRPIGPDVAIRFPFEIKAARDIAPLAEVRGRQIAYLKVLEQGQIVSTPIEGFGTSPADYDIRVENAAAGAGVRITADRPLARVNFWSIRTTACAEPFIEGRIEPRREFSWRIVYDFYTMPGR